MSEQQWRVPTDLCLAHHTDSCWGLFADLAGLRAHCALSSNPNNRLGWGHK